MRDGLPDQGCGVRHLAPILGFVSRQVNAAELLVVVHAIFPALTSMWHVLHLIARPIEALLGVFCILSAIVLYPDEEGKIQSKFEDFWIRVDDLKDLALTRHAAFMTGVAKLETRLLDRVFGEKIFSARAIGASAFCTLSSIALFILFDPRPFLHSMRAKRDFAAFLVMLVCIGISMFSLQLKARTRAFISVLGLFFRVPILLDMSHVGATPQDVAFLISTVGMAILAGFAGDVVFIACTRRIFRWAGQMQSSLKVLVAVVSTFLLAVFLVSPPVLAEIIFDMAGHADKAELPIFALMFSSAAALANFFDAILAFLFVFLALMLLIHRLLWPLLNRSLFRLTDIGTKGRRAILTTVGLALLAAGISDKVPELLQKLIEKLGG